MKKLMMKTAVIFCLCAVFAFGALKADTHAAEDVTGKKVTGFIDSGNVVHLRFRTFSKTGYTYELKGNGVTIPGTLSKDKTEVTVNLNSNNAYAKNKKYTLKITDKDTKNYMTATFYTGVQMKSFSAAQQGTTSVVKTKWSLPSGSDYSAYRVEICNLSDNLLRYASKNNGTSTTEATIDGPKIPSGTNVAYLIGMKDGAYGYSLSQELPFVVQPGKVTITVLGGKKAAHLSWNASKNATAYEVYIKKPGSADFKLAKTATSTHCTVKGLANGKKYSFKVKPIAQAGNTRLEAAFSSVKSIKLGKLPDPPKQFTFIVNDTATELGLVWAAVKGATNYEVWAKEKGKSEYEFYTNAQNRLADLRRLDASKTYNIVVYTISKSSKSAASKVLTVKPAKYIKKNRTKLLASKVRGIRYLSNGKCDITSRRYTQEVKEAYVNYKGLSSRTKYLIWVSLYTQQATIYTGSKGHWKMIRTFDIASGSYQNKTPRGTHRLLYHEKKWQHSGWRSSLVTHFYKKASFHMRPKYNNGKVKDPRMRKPISNACVRCYDDDAKFIYKLPLGTTVKIN